MADIVYSVKITLESVLVLDDCDWLGDGEIYFRAQVGSHNTGRSPIFKAGSGSTINLLPQKWSWEFYITGGSPIPITMQAWDEDLIWDDPLGKLAFSVTSPWTVGRFRTKNPSVKYELFWQLANTVIVPTATSFFLVSRQYNGSTYVSALAAPLVGIVKLTDIQGLNKPGVDDRAVKPPGTTKNSGFEAGYISQDDKGRIFTNRTPDGTWTKDTQFVDITAEILPAGIVVPPGTKITWSFEDPDDPTNEDPRVRKDAGKILDPNDYTGDVKTGANDGDNDPNGKKGESPRFEQVDPKYALSGSDTLVDVPTRISKVRFHVSDIASDNYRVKAAIKPDPRFTLTIPAQTGIMTVWHRVEIEYVKMATASELPVDEISKHYDLACVQVDVSLKRDVADKREMGTTDAAAFTESETYATSAGQFSKEGTKGWFFIAAANRFTKKKNTKVLWEGDAEAFGDRVRLPVGVTLTDAPAVVRVFNAAKIVGMPKPKPNDRDIHIKFRVSSQAGRNIFIEPHDFHLPEDPDTSFLDADLSTYGFAAGASIPVQVMSKGDEALVTAGISPGGASVGGKHFFGGKLLVFTKTMVPSEFIVTLCHELCHAFDNAHKCGNWDWINQPDKTACCMNYWFQFILDDATPRKPILWTQNKSKAELCAPHIRRMRDFHLESNPGLGWGGP